MTFSKEISYILQNKTHKTYWVSPFRGETSIPIAGVRFDNQTSANQYLYLLNKSDKVIDKYEVKKLTITVEVE